MGLIDLISLPGQQVAYLFPEVVGSGDAARSQTQGSGLNEGGSLSDVFIFQFWPSQLQDSYQPNYATKQIPGASHPLYQWVGGNGRTLSFEAEFVAEIDESLLTGQGSFNERIALSAATGPVPTGSAANAIPATLLPSSRYTVNVQQALAALQRYLYGRYHDVSGKKGVTEPPKKLVLVLPNTGLGRKDGDGVLCILLRADVTMESWFPTGTLRAAKVSLEFAECIQHTDAQGSKIKYIGADAYDDLANSYTKSGFGFNKVAF